MPDRCLAAQQVEEQALLGVVRAGRVARGRPDAAVALADELLDRERLVGAVAPVGTRLLVQPLRQRLGQAVGERLDHDRAVVVVRRARHAPRARVRAEAGGHGERADPVGEAGLARRDEVGERAGSARRCPCPSAGAACETSPTHARARRRQRRSRCRRRRRWQGRSRRRRARTSRPCARAAARAAAARRRTARARCRPSRGLSKILGYVPAQLPDHEERRPVDVGHELASGTSSSTRTPGKQGAAARSPPSRSGCAGGAPPSMPSSVVVGAAASCSRRRRSCSVAVLRGEGLALRRACSRRRRPPRARRPARAPPGVRRRARS